MRIYVSASLFLALVFLASGASASSFGSFPYQVEKHSSDLELKYRIGFINPGPGELEVRLQGESSEEYNLSFETRTLQIPGETTTEPSGTGWYHLGDGEYARVHQTSFQVDVSRYREDNRLEIPLRVEASRTGNSSGSGSESRIVQVRNYEYRAVIDPSLRPEERPEDESSGSSWRDSFWQEETSTSEEDFNLDRNQSSNQNPPGEEDNRPGGLETPANSSEQADPGKPLVNQTTLILVTGIVVSMAYILMEV